MKVSEACLNQPFLYSLFHTQLPCEADGIGSHCLSMAWQPAAMPKNSDSLDFFISQGARDSVVAAFNGQDGSTEVEEFGTCLFRCSIDIQRQLFRYTSPMLPVNSLPPSLYDDSDSNDAVDRNFKPVTKLKLYDQGRVMFGCSMGSLMVWMTQSMKHSHSLLLLDDINNVYDVGNNYVVAGSDRGDVGVWKAGSKSHLWRFNDTRRFENSRKTGYMKPEVSALKIAHGDDCAYVGDSLGSLSMCDFREPRIKTVSPINRGDINSIDIMGNKHILIGTEKGIIATLDSRMMGGSYGTKVLSEYTPAIANPVRSIQVNPHNPSVIACSGYDDIRIYKANPAGDLAPVFTHSLHQSAIADYSWHPDSEHKYTIGSLDTGEGFDTGEIQIWQPAMAKNWS
ncbi:hypothetical protein GGI15_002839 [Coemansia interrupta]|uniref:Uncharacterized protein n=1 Tax=Coemansia interrupta TaxID=1126814 RepID=A0A9W8LJ77_9FUNG|nr:hypothetical protein GGI15_002839 [Coemansia interrupta]